MSIVTSYDVFCDYPRCVEWTHGAVGRKASVGAARSVAGRKGWVHERYPRFSRNEKEDRCPMHVGDTKENSQ